MILSQTAIYAIKAVLHLAETEQRPLRVDDVARALDVPRNYLSKILHALAREGLLESTRGPRGGFELARSAEEILLSDVIDPFDEVSCGSGCLLGRAECSDLNPCAAHARWKEVSRSVRAFFRETTVRDLSAEHAPLLEAVSAPDRT